MNFGEMTRAIAAARTTELDLMSKRVNEEWNKGSLADDEAQRLLEEIDAQRKESSRAKVKVRTLPQALAFRPGSDFSSIKIRLKNRDRAKQFTHDGFAIPRDRNARTRIMHRARCLMRRTEAGRAYGRLTAKAVAVLEALVWGFHNRTDGRCFPAYEAIAAKAGCARSTVHRALVMLEDAGLLTWANRLVRVRDRVRDLFGADGRDRHTRVHRTSNTYRINDITSKSENQSRTESQKLTPSFFWAVDAGDGLAKPARGKPWTSKSVWRGGVWVIAPG